MKRKFILLTLVIATLIVPANLQAFESTVEEELQTPWEGFGYNQWGFARESDGNTFIVFTKCTFFIRSYYIKSIIILTTKILHQSFP